MTAMDKMWASFIGIGLMVLAAMIITFARTKTRGVVKGVLSVAAFLMLLLGLLYGLISMF